MIELGLVGEDIEGSLSPRIHAIALERAGIEGRYGLFPVEGGGLVRIVERMRASRTLVGLNVTIPFKEAVMPLLDVLSPEAEAIGAVNTVTRVEAGLSGENTDHTGFMRALEDAGFDAGGKRALVLGAGGAARAVLFALGRAGAGAVTVCARDREKAGRLALHFSSLGFGTDFLPEIIEGAPDVVEADRPNLVVNSTPLGSHRFPGMSPLPRRTSLHSGQLVVDIVYLPDSTPLLDEARERGARAMNGVSMLVHQALDSFAIWTGRRPAAGEVLERLELEGRRRETGRRTEP